MKPRLYSLFADTPIKGTEFLKYAQSQPDETQFAKDFSNLAEVNEKRADGQKRSEEYLISLVEKLQ